MCCKMYHLPLLPGYGPGVNVRSSAAPAPIVPTPSTEEAPVAISEAEEMADEATYFSVPTPTVELDSFIPSTSPEAGLLSEVEMPAPIIMLPPALTQPTGKRSPSQPDPDSFAEAVFFAYGVVVFFGLTEEQERGVLEDVQAAGAMQKVMPEERWEVEECHYEVRFNEVTSEPILIRRSTSLSSRTLASTMTFSVS